MIFAKEVGESLTYKFAQAAADMRAHGREIISLGLGEPDFKTPQYVLDATAEAMNARVDAMLEKYCPMADAIFDSVRDTFRQ